MATRARVIPARISALPESGAWQPNTVGACGERRVVADRLGALGAASHYTLIRALSIAPAAFVAPFGYTNMIWSTSVGVLVFAELPDAWTLIGAAIIIASGLYVLRREHVLRTTGPA